MSIIGRLNGIIQFIEHPCNEPWMVYVKASLPWANKVALAFVAGDPAQIIRSAARPKGSRSGGHLRRGSGKKKGNPFEIPDWNDKIGRKLNLDKHTNIIGRMNPIAQHGIEAIFEGINVIERGLWEYMILDLETQFLYHSIADARKSQYCKRLGEGDGLQRGPLTALGLLGWQNMNVFNHDYSSGHCQVGVGWAGADRPGYIHVAASFSGLALGGVGSQEYGMRITDGIGGAPISQVGPLPTATGLPVEVCCSATGKCPTILGVELFSNAGNLEGTGVIMATFWEQEPPKPPEHDKWKWATPHAKNPKRQKDGGTKSQKKIKPPYSTKPAKTRGAKKKSKHGKHPTLTGPVAAVPIPKKRNRKKKPPETP